MRPLRTFFNYSYSYWLFFLLLTYFTVYFYAQIIYVQWDWKSLPFAFAFTLFWAFHYLIVIIPVEIVALFLQRFGRGIIFAKTVVITLSVVLTCFPIFLFYKYYQGPPSLTLAGQAGDPQFLQTTGSYFVDPHNIVFYFLIPSLISFFYYRLQMGARTASRFFPKLGFLLLCILIGILGKEVVQKGIKRKVYIAEMSPYHPLYYMYVAQNNPFKSYFRHGFGSSAKSKISQDDLEFAKRELRNTFSNNPRFVRSFKGEQFLRTEIANELDLPRGIKPNLVFLLMESLSSFHLDERITPFLSNFGEIYPQSIIFENFFACGDQTVKGQHAIFCGQYVTPLGKIATDYKNLKMNCLPHILREELGYRVQAFNGVQSTFHNKKGYLEKVVGFDYMEGVETMPKDIFVRGAWGSSDLSALKYTLSHMNKMKRPYLFQLMSVNYHSPFKLPADAKELSISKEVLKDTPLSSQILAYDDASLKHFFEKAAGAKDFQNTIFIITADTGGGHTHKSNLSQFDLFEIRNKIPLIIYSPLFKKLAKPMRISHLMSQYSVAPLVLDMMGFRATNSFIGIPETLYGNKRGQPSEENSYVAKRLGFISKVYNMQLRYFEGNDLVLSSGFQKFYGDSGSLRNGAFSHAMNRQRRDRLNRGFNKSYNFWQKVYMPMLHFNQLLVQ